MNTFLVVAAIMAAIAAAVVALPLLRDRQSRVLGAVVSVLVIGAAAGLYPLWSNWNWHAPAESPGAAAPNVAAMVAKLEKRLQDQPNDVNGWLLLGRSYLALQRTDEAVTAYEHAHRLDAKNADAAIGLGEAMSLRAGGEITPQAAEMFEAALTLAPSNPNALLYGGFAAAVRGDRALARSRWQALKSLHPPQQIEAMLDARIAELDAAEGAPADAANSAAGGAGSAPATAGNSSAGAAGGVGNGSAAGTNASPPGTGTSAGDLGAATATVNISIAPTLKARLKPEAPLFLFAREPGSRGPPLAAKRLTSAAIGTQVQLSSSDSMLPGRILLNGHRVSITARVSFSGQPTPAAGDLYGELSYDVGQDGIRNLVIDHVTE